MISKLIVWTLVLSLASTVLTTLLQTPCDRYICLSQPSSTAPAKDKEDQYYTGIMPNHGVCVVKVDQSGGNSNYYLQECMYPKYECAASTDTTNVGICVLRSPYESQNQQTSQKQQNGLYDGEWCLSNFDCASGLCDNVDYKALLQVDISDAAHYKVIQNRTNKCYVRNEGDECQISNNYRYHQQCGKGLRCARNDSTTYTCQTALPVGSDCTANTQYLTGGGSNSWERCVFGSDCIQTNGDNNYKCQAWFSLGQSVSFNYISTYTNNDYALAKTIFDNIDNLGTWMSQANRMCNSTVAAGSTVTGYTYACQTAKSTEHEFGNICGNDTYCQGSQSAANMDPQCSCAFFNQDGNAYCRGFVGNTDWFETVENQTWQGYFSNQSTFNSCYPYEIWNQFAVTNQTTCDIPQLKFANPAPNRTMGNCYDSIGYPSSLTRPSNIGYWQGTIMTQTTNIPNFPIETAKYSFLPSAYWFKYLPNQQTGQSYVGKCPQFLCEQIWVESPELNSTSETSSKVPARKGACAYYDELANIWSIQNCRSPYDFCQVCLPVNAEAYHASSGVTTTSEADKKMCRGYSVTQLTKSQDFASGNLALPKAWKCQRSDGTLKRIFDYCWDDFDCLSGICDASGECTVLTEGQICKKTIQCDKNLVCAYHNSTDNTETCQPAIPAGQLCTIDTYSRCKLGSKCVQIRGEPEARCTNYFSLAGLTVFSFLDTRMPNYENQKQLSDIQGIEGIPSDLQGAFNMMCTTGAYSNSADNSGLYVDYEGCLHFTKTTRGGWPKECFKEQYDCQSVQSFNYIRNNYDSGKTVTLDGTCNCVQKNGIFATSTNQYDLFNSGGIGYCEGFPGEKDNSLLQMRRTYEQDFVNCYPYEVLRNTDQLKPYQGWLAIGGECGYVPQIKYNPMPLKPFPKCYRNIFIDRSIGWKNTGTLYYLWRRCPQYACVTTLDQAVCRYFNESTQVVSLQACANGDSCNQFNGTYYLCGYTTPILKDIGQNCFFDIECKTQVCGARDAEGNPDYSVPNRKCTTIPNGKVCQVHQNCINGSRCVPQISSTSIKYNETYNFTVDTNNSYGSVCLPALKAGENCSAAMPDQCKYGSQCVKLYNAVSYTCVNYYSLAGDSKIEEPTITNTQVYADVKVQTGILGELGRLCASGYYYLDQWTTIQQGDTMQITGRSGCFSRKLGTYSTSFTGFQHPCQQNLDCVSNLYQGNTTRYKDRISDIGVCNCSYWNDWGYGYCNGFESDDTKFLNASQTYYNQTFDSCYPYQYLDGYTINNSTTSVTGCYLPYWSNWYTPIYVSTNATDSKNHSYYSTSFGNECYQSVGLELWSGTWQIQQPHQNQNYPYFCPQYSCVGNQYNISTDGVDWAICRHYSTNEQSFWLLRSCTDNDNVCTYYNETVWVCERTDGKLKGVGETCFNGGQCMSQICDLKITATAGKCNVRNVSEPCEVHENCDKNLRCGYFTWQQKESMAGETKYCQTAIPANAVCSPFTAVLCRHGTTCALINNQPTPICIPWYSLPSGTNVTIISNYSQYPQVNYFSTVQTMYSELCQSGLYDPSYGCLPTQEITAQGWPSACSVDDDCVGLYYGTPGTCTCDNKNQDGTGYCKGFDGEANNKTQTWFLSYQRSFVTCYPYEIDNLWGSDGDCNYTNYSTYDSAPYDSIGECYAAVGVRSKLSNVTKPKIIESILQIAVNYATVFQSLVLLALAVLIII